MSFYHRFNFITTVPRVRIELTTLRFSFNWLGFLQGSDYFISVLLRVRSRALTQDYCWAHLLVSTPAFAKATAGKPS